MSTEAWVTLAVAVAAVAIMARGLLPPAAAMFGAMVVLFVGQIIDREQALSGFANPAPFTVAALFVVAGAVQRTGALAPAVAAMLGGGSGYRRSAARLLAPTAASSAILNNTPIVAMLAPVVTSWSERAGRSPSRYLMPLSFAAILGGLTTAIGTSTNLVVSGLLESSHLDPIGMFEITKLGLPIAVMGVTVVVFLAPVVLPARRAARREMQEEARDFAVEMVIEPGGPLDGNEVEAGGLRHLQGVYLVQIERGSDMITPVPPTTVLHGGDQLRFVGRADQVLDLQNIRGLASSHSEHLIDFETGAGAFFEVVLGAASPLVGRTLREVEFRGRYQAAVIAIHRAGQRVNAKLGEVRLRAGDTLLLLGDPEFQRRWYDSRDFLLISRLDGVTPQRAGNSVIVGAVVAGIVVAAGAGLLTILEASLLGVLVLVGTRVMTPTAARNAVDLDVIITIASAFGLAAAVRDTGLAAEFSDGIVNALDGLGPRGVLLGLVLSTVILTELVTNNAAAVLMFPVGIAAAPAAGVEPLGVAIAIAIAASASFLTPIGYQTNMMVYGPGGYRFTDYLRLGLPLTVMVVVSIVAFTPVLWGT